MTQHILLTLVLNPPRRYHKSIYPCKTISLDCSAKKQNPHLPTLGSANCPCRAIYSAALPPSVIATAATRISPPPTHAKGLSVSPISLIPRKDPSAGSMFRNTPAREAGT